MSLRAALLAAVLCCAIPCVISSQGVDAEELPGRVVSVSRDGRTIVVSRGMDVNVRAGSRCVVRPDRTSDSAEVEWDIAIAEGRVTEPGTDSAVVEIASLRDAVRVGDYCALAVSLPTTIKDTDIGRIAWYGMTFIGKRDNTPLFMLADLVRGPIPEVQAAIVQRILAHVHEYALTDEKALDRRIAGGIFAGMTIKKAFQAATLGDVERFLEYFSYRITGYINKTYILTDLFQAWMEAGAESGEPYKSRERAKPLIAKGNALAKDGRYPEAMEALNESLGAAPDHEEAKKRLALVDSVIAKDRILVEDAGDVTAQAQMGKDLYALARYADALTHLRTAKNLGSADPEVDRTIGYALTALERYTEASAVFAALRAGLPRDEALGRWSRYTAARAAQSGKERSAESYLIIAGIYYEFADYTSAIAACNAALEIQPDMPSAWALALKASKRRSSATRQGWAKQYWQSGAFNSAKLNWRRAEEICAEIGDAAGRISALADMAAAMYDSSFNEEALAVHHEILAIDPKNSSSCINIARCYTSMKDYEQAIEWARQGIRLDPSSAWGHTVLGNIELHSGALDDAIPHLEEAARLDPGYIHSLTNLGAAYVLKKEYEKARGSYLAVLKVDAAYQDARRQLAAIECVLETKGLLARDPANEEARIRLGKALYSLDDNEEAMRELSRVVAANGKSLPALITLGYAYDSMDRHEESEQCLAKADSIRPTPVLRTWIQYERALLAIARDPGNPSGHIALGDAYVGFAQFDNALAQYERARELGSGASSLDARMEQARTGKEADRLRDIGDDFYRRRDFDKTIEYDAQALPLYHSLGDGSEEFTVRMNMGTAYTQLFRHAEARACLAEAGRIAEELGDESLQASYLSAMGDHDFLMGDMPGAQGYKTRALAIFHRNNDPMNETGTCLNTIGQIQGNLGEQDAMIGSYTRALEIFRRLADANGENWTLSSLGWAYATQGDYSKALDRMQQALRTAHDAGDRQGEVNAYRGIGNIYMVFGDTARALEQFVRCESAATALGSKWDRAVINNSIGLLHLDLTKEYDKAIARFQTCAVLGRQIGDARLEGCALGNVGVAYSRQGKAQEALSFQEEGLRLVRSVRNTSLEMQGLNFLGETYQRLGDYGTALARHLEAISLCETMGTTTELWKLALNTGKDYEATGDTAKALELYTRAVGILAGITNRISNEQLRQGFGGQERQTEAYQRLIDLLLKLGRTEATHGIIRENPLESYLLFAGDITEAQQLTLLEIAGYTAMRARTSLVFLSACETAVEKSAGNGSELISLAEAFAMAGTPTLVATLWMVDDEATSRLVLEFYRQIGSGDTLDALRTAQLSLLRSTEFSLPYFWAPFVMMGSWR